MASAILLSIGVSHVPVLHSEAVTHMPPTSRSPKISLVSALSILYLASSFFEIGINGIGVQLTKAAVVKRTPSFVSFI